MAERTGGVGMQVGEGNPGGSREVNAVKASICWGVRNM